MGICGAGMAPLADLLLRFGARVSGCDLRPEAAACAPEAIRVWHGHDPSHLEECAALIVTAAVPPAHPEMAAARDLGIPVIKRAAALGALVDRGTTVAVAGTHGKTTTTALTTAVLTAAGLDPTGIVGARVPAWNGNLRHGGDRYFVVEADEYDRSFLSLRPRIAVVTTLEADHLDTYGSLAAVTDAFRSFVDLVPPGGLIVGCADDHGVGQLLAGIPGRDPRVVTYGTSAGSMLRAEDVRVRGECTEFSLREEGEKLGAARLWVPGLHNVRNALAAVAVARSLGADWDRIAEGLAGFAGAERRFERIGEARGVMVIDDYAHHPTELRATLQAARSAHPDRRIVAVFQPHLFSRTRDFADEFGQALAEADLAFVTDIYPAREAPLPGITGELVADAALGAGADVSYVADRARIPATVAGALRPGDLCLTLGAGDLNLAAREILSLLQLPTAR